MADLIVKSAVKEALEEINVSAELYDVYAEDIEYRKDIYPTDGISNIETDS